MVAHPAFSQAVSPDEAGQYISTNITVKGLVSQVSQSRSGTIFINFGGEYPNVVFFAVIFDDYLDQFTDVFSLEGAVIAVTGTVKMYRGKPEIILTSNSQIKLQ
jgi:DNA/RNA endonuclease YhcR with UshA esterase domain